MNFYVPVFICLLWLHFYSATAVGCAPKCQFSLCEPSMVSLRKPSDVAQTSAICLKGQRLGIVNSGEAYIRRDRSRYTPISKVRRAGLKQAYSPHFFKTFVIRNMTSGVGHETPQQNQSKFLNETCIALPLQEYQTIQQVGKKVIVRDNIILSRKRPLRDCVSFISRL